MTTVEELEREIQKLDRAELAALREWFHEYDADDWHRQIEADVKAGKLDGLAEEVIAAHKSGNSKGLLPSPSDEGRL